MLLPLQFTGEPVLRQQGRELAVPEVRSAEIERLIEQMRETMRNAPGVGLAAPQVGLGLQLAVIEDQAEYQKDIRPEVLAARERRPVPFHVVINPVLRLEPGAEAEFFEGCLSVPGLTALVSRAMRVRVDCLDHRGDPQTLRASGWYARILQHEIDHLNGILYVDRMEPRSLCTLEGYSKHWKNLEIADVRARLGLPFRMPPEETYTTPAERG